MRGPCTLLVASLVAVSIAPGCSSQNQSTNTQVATRVTTHSTTSTPTTNHAPSLVVASSVNDLHPARSTLYTWTTPESLSRAIESGSLLHRPRPTTAATQFDVALSTCAQAGNQAAQLLLEDRFRDRRYSWTSPWATFLGWKSERYGRTLVRIDLSDQSWVGIYNTRDAHGSCSFRFEDMNHLDVTLEQVLAHPERLAAIYHTTLSQRDDHVPLREFVVVNEDMIERWSANTDEIRAEIESSLATLSQWKTEMDRSQPPVPAAQWAQWVGGTVWPSPSSTSSPWNNYASALAFPNENYLGNTASFDTLQQELSLVLDEMSEPYDSTTPRVEGVVAARPSDAGVRRRTPPRRRTCAPPVTTGSDYYCTGNCHIAMRNNRVACVPNP